MDILREVYHSLQRRDYIDVDVPTSEVFYARAAIEQRTGIRLDIYTVRQYLEEEGLLRSQAKKS